MHKHVPNCLIHPLPDFDAAGQALRDVDAAIDNLGEVGIARLRGDADRIMESAGKLIILLQLIDPPHNSSFVASGIQGLRIVLNRIEALQSRQAAE